MLHQRAGIFRRVCIIAVSHQVAFRFYFLKHPAHDIPLALLVLIAYHSPGSAGNVIRPVLGVVVINIDYGFRQFLLKLLHHFLYGLGFVIARNENSYLIHILLPQSVLLLNILTRRECRDVPLASGLGELVWLAGTVAAGKDAGD